MSAPGPPPALARRPASRPGLITFGRMKAASFAHSTVYAVLLVVWLVPGLHAEEMVFGFAHGIGWILMCLLAVEALRRRVIDLRLAVAIAVIGAIGPFVGSYEFVRRGRRSAGAGARTPR